MSTGAAAGAVYWAIEDPENEINKATLSNWLFIFILLFDAANFIEYKLFMQEPEKPIDNPTEDASNEELLRDQNARAYYYDDAHGYQTYDPNNDEDLDEPLPRGSKKPGRSLGPVKSNPRARSD